MTHEQIVQEYGRIGGSKRSEAKTKAARANIAKRWAKERDAKRGQREGEKICP